MKYDPVWKINLWICSRLRVFYNTETGIVIALATIHLLSRCWWGTAEMHSSYLHFFQGRSLGVPAFIPLICPSYCTLRSSSLFSGFCSACLEHCAFLYADDLQLYISYSTGSVDIMLDILKARLGWKLNIAKSKCFPLNQAAKVIDPTLLPFSFLYSLFQMSWWKISQYEV